VTKNEARIGNVASRIAGGHMASLRGLFTRATLIFLYSRLAIWAAAVIALGSFPISALGQATPTEMAHPGTLDFGAGLWSRWDSFNFEQIAKTGYGNDGIASFYPFYPAWIGVVGRALGGDYALAGLLLSLAACLAAFELFWRFAREHLGSGREADRTVLYLALTPMAVFLGAVYSESTFLLLALAAALLAERRRWALASSTAALALLTRPTGIAVVAMVAVLAWPNRRALAWLLVVPLAFAAYPVILDAQFGQPWAFVTAEKYWSRHLSPFGPFGGLWDGVNVLWRYSDHQIVAANVENLVYTLVYLVFLYLVWRERTLAEGVFATIALLGPLSVPRSGHFPLMSMPRFGLVIFPFYLVLARLGSTPRRNAAILGISALLLGVEVVKWVTFQWVS
jgi:hypothetical protein